MKIYYAYFISILLYIGIAASAQKKIRDIRLRCEISGKDWQFSGMTIYNSRVYLLPQFGGRNKNGTLGRLSFNIYSISLYRINLALNQNVSVPVSHCKEIRILNFDKLNMEVRSNTEGCEAILIHNDTVYLTVEKKDSIEGYIIKGKLDTVNNTVSLDGSSRKLIIETPQKNMGFESIAFIKGVNKIFTLFEKDEGGKRFGYIINPDLSGEIKKVSFDGVKYRITDMAFRNDSIYFINSYYDSSDKKNQYAKILSKRVFQKENESTIMFDNKYLEISNLKCDSINWEGLALYKGGAILISDDNYGELKSVFGYLGF